MQIDCWKFSEYRVPVIVLLSTAVLCRTAWGKTESRPNQTQSIVNTKVLQMFDTAVGVISLKHYWEL